jgi:sugar phosphate isomerase/epimerase
MVPGEGNIDFTALFKSLESAGYTGHYSMAYGSLEQKVSSRNWLAGLI